MEMVDETRVEIEETERQRGLDDRNGVRFQEKVRLSLYSGGALGVRVIRGEQDQEAGR
jgi:hypothetical protein